MSNNIIKFQEEHPSIDSYWRSIILFGNNVASYKFALAKSLLEIVINGRSIITLDELAKHYSKHICEHLLHSPKQATNNTSKFLQACMNYNKKKITAEQLIDITVKDGFNYVLDTFHHVNNQNLTTRFFEKDYSRSSKKIILTDNIFKIDEMVTKENFEKEIESRWNLVETAWELGISRNLLNVGYDEKSQTLFVDKVLKRKDITSVRGALNGYQKGKCFYCFDDIIVTDDEHNTCEVDHFYPHILQKYMLDVNVDGIWNLVLTCKKCNRGEHGKFSQIPILKYLERLHKRNEFLISSHHPLRETIMNQTGKNELDRRLFLNNVDKKAISMLLHRWEVEQIGEEVF